MSAPVVRLIDDDASVRTAVGRLLRAAGYEVRAYASSGEYLLDPGGAEAGCMILDLRMAEPNGLALQRALGERGGALPVVFLTGHGDIGTSVQAMRQGAVDFLTKPVRKEALLAAVAEACERDSVERASRTQHGALQARLDSLTAREHEVLRCVIRGRLNKQIADELGMAERTVKAHRATLMRKMEARSLAELVHLAGQLGLMAG